MKIDKVIFACDDNPMYKDFWDITSEICYKRLGIKPVLFHITDVNSDFEDTKFGIVKRIKKVNGLDTGFQSQIVRMYGLKYLPDEVCLISDIDMFMLNKKYFIDSVKNYDNNDIVIYSSDAYNGDLSRLPMCYNAGLGSNFIKLLDLNTSFEEFAKRLKKFNPTWSCDERYFTHMVKINLKNFNFQFLKRGWIGSKKIATNRIDRVDWNWSNDRMSEYIDCHSLRPYKDYKEQIDQLKNSILNGY